MEVRKTQAVLKGREGAFQLVEVIGFAAPDSALLVQSTFGISCNTRSAEAKALFRGDMETQGQMLSHMLQFLVYAMARPETMALGLRDLGRRHAGYGVVAGHYPAFRHAFLESARAIPASNCRRRSNEPGRTPST